MEVLIDHFAPSDNIQDENVVHKRMRELTEEQIHTHDAIDFISDEILMAIEDMDSTMAREKTF